jgi:hypothetical protein
MNEQADFQDFTTVDITNVRSRAAAKRAAMQAHKQQALRPAGIYAAGAGTRRVLWPVTIGAISVALGAWAFLDLLGYAIQFGLLAASRGERDFGSVFKGDFRLTVSVGLILLKGIIAVFLFTAGLLVVQQSRLGLKMHKAYAIITILLSVGLSILQAIHLPEGVAGIFGSGRARTYLITSLITSSLWRTTTQMIYPVFLLIWFSRPKVQAETHLWR